MTILKSRYKNYELEGPFLGTSISCIFLTTLKWKSNYNPSSQINFQNEMAFFRPCGSWNCQPIGTPHNLWLQMVTNGAAIITLNLHGGPPRNLASREAAVNAHWCCYYWRTPNRQLPPPPQKKKWNRYVFRSSPSCIVISLASIHISSLSALVFLLYNYIVATAAAATATATATSAAATVATTPPPPPPPRRHRQRQRHRHRHSRHRHHSSTTAK